MDEAARTSIALPSHDVSAGDRYATPAAFRRALTDRLRVAAGMSVTLQQLQRQLPMTVCSSGSTSSTTDGSSRGDRTPRPEHRVRGSLDVDLYREQPGRWRKRNCGVLLPRTSATGSNSRSAVARPLYYSVDWL